MAYTQPTPTTFKLKYPAFANVPDLTVQAWLDEAHDETTRWPDDGRAKGEMLYTAHMLAVNGQLAGVVMPDGVTNFKSADFSATIAEGVASRTGWNRTEWGREYRLMQRRYFSGGTAAWTPPVAC